MSLFNFSSGNNAAAPANPAPSTASLFASLGNSSQQQTQPQPSTSAFGGFGQTNNAARSSNNAGGGLFGGANTQQQQTGGQQQGGGGLFGGFGSNNNQSTSGAGAGAGSGLFGASTQNQAQGQVQGQSTSLFGQPAQQQQQPAGPTSSFSFLNPPQNQTNNQTPFNFSKPSEPQTNGQAPFSFLNPNPNPTNSLFQPNQSTLGNSTANPFGQSTNNPPLTQSTLGPFAPNQSTLGRSIYANSAAVGPRKKTLQERLSAVAYAACGSNEQKAVKSYVYINAPAPNEQEHVWNQGVQNLISKDLFDEAQRHNPNRAYLFPVQITGYQEMAARVEVQVKSQEQQSQYAAALLERLSAAYEDVTQSLTISLESKSTTTIHILTLLIRYVADFAHLVRLIRGSDLSSKEEATYRLLKDVVKTYEAAGNGGRMEGRLAELYAGILRLKQVVDRGYEKSGRFEWDTLTEQELEKIFKEQGKALLALQHVALDQKFDVTTMEKGFALVV